MVIPPIRRRFLMAAAVLAAVTTVPSNAAAPDSIRRPRGIYAVVVLDAAARRGHG